jgi:hypothetical protein
VHPLCSANAITCHLPPHHLPTPTHSPTICLSKTAHLLCFPTRLFDLETHFLESLCSSGRLGFAVAHLLGCEFHLELLGIVVYIRGGRRPFGVVINVWTRDWRRRC